MYLTSIHLHSFRHAISPNCRQKHLSPTLARLRQQWKQAVAHFPVATRISSPTDTLLLLSLFNFLSRTFHSSALRVYAARSSETSVPMYQATRRHTPRGTQSSQLPPSKPKTS
jgi:hypothetical protein